MKEFAFEYKMSSLTETTETNTRRFVRACDKMFGILFDCELARLYDIAENVTLLQECLISLLRDRQTHEEKKQINKMASINPIKLAGIFCSFYRRICDLEFLYFTIDYPEDDREALEVFARKYRIGAFGSARYIGELKANVGYDRFKGLLDSCT